MQLPGAAFGRSRRGELQMARNLIEREAGRTLPLFLPKVTDESGKPLETGKG